MKKTYVNKKIVKTEIFDRDLNAAKNVLRLLRNGGLIANWQRLKKLIIISCIIIINGKGKKKLYHS